MTRHEAIQNCALCMNYLSMYQPKSYLTADITPHDVRLHFFDLNKTKEEVERAAKDLDPLRLAGSEIRYDLNEHLGATTFDIIWPYGWKEC